MILETFVAVNSALFATRAINTKVEEKMKEKILSDGLYHVTTEENAEKIMESGHIRPSGYFLSLGAKKCFFFAGTPSYKDLASNCASEAKKYEFKAVKIMPNEEELSKFKQRTFNDDSITYKGKCYLPEERTKIVDLVLDINEKGDIYTREKTEEELQNGYVPKEELTEKMSSITNNNVVGIMGKAYLKEYDTVGRKIWGKLIDFKNRIIGSKKLTLPEENAGNLHNVEMTREDNISGILEKSICNEKNISENYLKEDNNVEDKNLNIEKEERVCE